MATMALKTLERWLYESMEAEKRLSAIQDNYKRWPNLFNVFLKSSWRTMPFSGEIYDRIWLSFRHPETTTVVIPEIALAAERSTLRSKRSRVQSSEKRCSEIEIGYVKHAWLYNNKCLTTPRSYFTSIMTAR